MYVHRRGCLLWDSLANECSINRGGNCLPLLFSIFFIYLFTVPVIKQGEV